MSTNHLLYTSGDWNLNTMSFHCQPSTPPIPLFWWPRCLGGPRVPLPPFPRTCFATSVNFCTVGNPLLWRNRWLGLQFAVRDYNSWSLSSPGSIVRVRRDFFFNRLRSTSPSSFGRFKLVVSHPLSDAISQRTRDYTRDAVKQHLLASRPPS